MNSLLLIISEQLHGIVMTSLLPIVTFVNSYRDVVVTSSEDGVCDWGTNTRFGTQLGLKEF